MEVAPLHATGYDHSLQTFTDFMDTVKHEEEVASDDDLVFTSDEEHDDEIVYEHLETLFGSNFRTEKCVILQTGEAEVNDSDRHKLANDIDISESTEVDILKAVDYECLECSKHFSTNNKLNRHLKSHSKVRQKGKSTNECGVCQRTFRDKHTLVHHMYIHTGEQPYKCDDCGKRFRQKGALAEHKINRHNSNNIQFKCAVCDKSFRKLSIFNQHMNIHKGVRFPCTVCNKSFSAPGSLKNHMKLHTDSLQKSDITCSICEKVFTSEVNLKLHMETHEGTQTLSCNICDAMFSRNADLQGHIHIHTGEKPYKCSLCPKVFRQPGDLGRHVAWHRGDNTCKYCGRRYARKDELLRHVYLHEKGLDTNRTSPNHALQCEVCLKFFSNHIKLQMHSKTHRREDMKHTCNKCGKTLSTSSNYNRHMREIHNVNLNSEIDPIKAQPPKHVKNVPFECDLCSKRCKNKRALTEHVNFVHLKITKHRKDPL